MSTVRHRAKIMKSTVKKKDTTGAPIWTKWLSKKIWKHLWGKKKKPSNKRVKTNIYIYPTHKKAHLNPGPSATSVPSPRSPPCPITRFVFRFWYDFQLCPPECNSGDRRTSFCWIKGRKWKPPPSTLPGGSLPSPVTQPHSQPPSSPSLFLCSLKPVFLRAHCPYLCGCMAHIRSVLCSHCRTLRSSWGISHHSEAKLPGPPPEALWTSAFLLHFGVFDKCCRLTSQSAPILWQSICILA